MITIKKFITLLMLSTCLCVGIIGAQSLYAVQYYPLNVTKQGEMPASLKASFSSLNYLMPSTVSWLSLSGNLYVGGTLTVSTLSTTVSELRASNDNRETSVFSAGKISTYEEGCSTILITPTWITASLSGATTFAINAETGDATFAGALTTSSLNRNSKYVKFKVPYVLSESTQRPMVDFVIKGVYREFDGSSISPVAADNIRYLLYSSPTVGALGNYSKAIIDSSHEWVTNSADEEDVNYINETKVFFTTISHIYYSLSGAPDYANLSRREFPLTSTTSGLTSLMSTTSLPTAIEVYVDLQNANVTYPDRFKELFNGNNETITFMINMSDGSDRHQDSYGLLIWQVIIPEYVDSLPNTYNP